MSNEQKRGTPILSLEDVGGVQSTSMLKPEGGSDPGLSSGSESKDLLLSGNTSQSAAHHSLDGEQANSASAVPDTTIFHQHEINSSDSGGTPSTAHSTLSEAASIHTDNFTFASVSGSDAVNLNDSFASQDVVHSQFGASAADSSAAATGSELWTHNLLGAHLNGRETVQGAETHHTSQPDGSGPGDPDGQLWAADDGDTSGNPDGHGSDARIEHMDSDGLSSDHVDAYGITSTGAFISVGLDTAANLYFAEDNQDNFYVGHISTGANISETTIASTSDLDVTNSFVVDPANNTIYMDLDGGDYTADGGDIIKITYSPTTGSISSPYNPSNFAINLNDVLVDSTSSGGIYQDGRAFAISGDGSTLYYVDDDDDNAGAAFTADTNGIYKISTSGDVGQGTAPTPVLLSTNTQFPTNDSAGYITGIAVNQAQGLIYFTTDALGEGVNTSEDAIWYMPITGGTATKMTLPGGVTLEYAAFYSNGIAFDPDARVLYVTDTERDAVIQLQLNAGGTAFSSGNNDFYTTDTNSSDGASTYALTWGDLATESSLTGTSSITTQGSGSGTTLLTSTPTITNPEGTYIANLEGYTIRVIGGSSGNGSVIGVELGAINSGAGLVGDELYINGVQSGTVDGGQVTVSWNNSTQTLTLTGDVSESEYQSLLSGITFQENASTDTTQGTHPTRVIDFIANDGITVLNPTTSDPNEQTITITLNRAPTVVTESFTAVEGSSASGTAGVGGTGGLESDSDLDGDSLTISAITGGTLGTALSGTYGQLTLNADGSYTYNANNTSAINSAATGSHPVDTYTYTVSDGHGGTTTQTIHFTIDRPPTVVTENVSLLESGSASGTSGTSGTGGLDGDSDADGDSLSISAITGGTVGSPLAGTYGSLTLSLNGTYTYNATNTSAINSAATGSHPVDTFTYTVSDGHGGTTLQTINFTIDRAPSVVTESVADVENATASGTAGTGGTGGLSGDSDPDGDSLTITAVTGGALGTALNGTYGALTLNANGTYSYVANNTSAINSAATGSHPVDSFTYTVSDGHGATTLQTINITIDRPPAVVTESSAVVESATASGTAGIAGTGALDGDSDRDGDSLTITAITGGAVGSSVSGTYGSLTLNADGSYSYLANNTSAINAAATGSHPVDSFTYTVSDGHGGTTTQTINFTIDRAPAVVTENSSVFASGSVSGTSGTAGSGGLGGDSDPDGDSLTITAVTGGTLGTALNGTYGALTLNADGSYTYNANNTAAINAQPDNAVLTDTFTYSVSDGHGGTTTATLVFTVDQAPTVSSLTASATSSANFSAAHTVTFTLDVGKNVTVANGTTLTLSDGGTATYVSGSGTQSITFTYSATDAPGALTVSSISAGSIADAAGNPLSLAGTSVSPYTDAVTDSAANVESNFASLDSAVADISSITLNDSGTPILALTASEIINDQTLIGKIVSTYHLVAYDTAANIGSNFDSLETYASSIAAVAFTDSGTPTLDLTQTQVTNDATLLGKVYGAYDLLVSGVTGHAYTSYQNDYNASETLTQTTDFNTNGSDTFYGYVSGLSFTGTSHNDTFYLESASSVTASGGAGNDLFFFGSAFSSSDQIDGGTGVNTLELDGTYTAGNALSISTSMMTNIQNLLLVSGHSYNITLDAGVVTTGQSLTVTASGLGASDALTFDGSAETAGTLVVYAGAGATDLTGSGGTNEFIMGANLTASDVIDGGTGTTSVNLDGDYSGGLAFTSTTMTNVGTIVLSAGFSYDLTLNAATVGSGQTMTIQGTSLGASDNMTIDGSAVTAGNLIIDGGAGSNALTGSAGNDVIRAGSGSDFITGGAGADKLYASTGADTFAYNAVSDSTSTTHDTIYGFNASGDMIDLLGSLTGVTVVDAAVTTGHLSNVNFDASLAHDIGAAQLSAHGAVLFTPSSGGLAGDTFLIIDENGVAGYQASQDLVIQLTNGTNLASLSTANFETTV